LGVSTDTTTHTTPIKIPGLDHCTAIAAGDGHGVALRSDGTVWTWGINTDGQTGLTQDTNHPFPEPVPNLDRVIAIAAGDNYTLLLQDDGTIWASGYNGNGQLGDGSTTSRSVFAEVTALVDFTAITAGESYALALDVYGDVWAWGDNRLGQIGTDPAPAETIVVPTHVPLPQSGMLNVAIASGGSHGLALNENGSLYSWGYNGLNQLGYATDQTVSPTPQLVPLLDTVATISAGDNNNLVLTSAGTLWAWGDNQFGQIGDGTTKQHSLPVSITLPSEQ
jgi:alpha-tubulin suppressor-like RCC1 family protein